MRDKLLFSLLFLPLILIGPLLAVSHGSELKMLPTPKSLTADPAPPAPEVQDIQFALQKVLSVMTPEMRLSKPTDVAVAQDGSIFIVDTALRGVLKLKADGSYVDIWFGPDEYKLAFPSRVVTDAGRVIVGDKYEGRILVFNGKDGKFLKVIGQRGSEPGQFMQIGGLCVTARGNLLVAALNRDKIIEYDSHGNFLREFGETGDQPGQFFGVTDVGCGAGGEIFAADLNDRVQLFAPDGVHQKGWGQNGSELGQFRDPEGIELDPRGLMYVADTGNGRIQLLDRSEGTELEPPRPTVSFGNGELKQPTGVTLAPDGRILVADPQKGTVTIWEKIQVTTIEAPPAE